jgi:methylthioribose-1-phosphate isomerase
MIAGGMLTPVELTASAVRMLDQRKLPHEERWVELHDAAAVAAAIREMVVRGAPAIGISAAFGLVLGARAAAAQGPAGFAAALQRDAATLLAARPTAVNLRWAIERMQRAAAEARASGADNGSVAVRLEAEARAIHREDLAACLAMGRHGATLVPQDATILTHCNAGGLATAGYGTALGVIRGAVAAGKRVRVLADETRPFLQGSRLTAWELLRDGIDTTLITDSMAGSLMYRRQIDLVVVGSDRIAANGDVANKIGTYAVAVLAHENRVPFYVAAPTSTIDLACPDGDAIPIEQRPAAEVTELMGHSIAPAGVRVLNPAFDVTPARYVRAIVTEQGIARPPYSDSLRRLIRG